ncbi:unnamed protein product [Cuscuta epithymum]|uniref:Homeobox domain-containing protein n=1 Tax=Cuscuta epithymum TaxID=186058 RepID=A0AAV0DEI7_9ASTE|nr:unnamed protein product [Cuscuta epithymum]
MAGSYFHGSSGIGGGGDGLQTLILMNPAGSGYVGFSDTTHHTAAPAPGANNFALLQSMSSVTLPHAPPQSHSQQFVGVPFPTAAASQQDITAIHELFRNNYSDVYGPPVGMGSAREVARAQQGLSLTLASSQHGKFRADSEARSQQILASPASGDDQVRAGGGGSCSPASGISNCLNSRHLDSRYLKAAQELLDEVVNVGRAVVKNGAQPGQGGNCRIARDPGGVEAAGVGEVDVQNKTELTTAERQEFQLRKAKLLNMLDEVEQRYRQYYQEMHMVISWFEQAAGIGSAKTYTSLALQTISKQFRCLKDAILSQIRAASKNLGEEGVGVKNEGSSRLKYVDNQLRQQRALQQMGMIHQNAWRPQRGLPERSVSVLRAWLFEHFLHPYPKDSDKSMLAKQTGLTRSQVSNWFINARVRLWKPMVEEMYLEEIKEKEKNGEGENEEAEIDQDSASLQEKSPCSEHANPTCTNHTMSMTNGASISQGSPKKPRNSEMLHTLVSSLPSLGMKFVNDEGRNREDYTSMEGSTNFMAAFGSYPMDQMGRFNAEQFPSPYSGNAVSLTLGLQHPENHRSFLPNHGVVMGEGNDFGGMATPTSHQTNVFENFNNIQNRKRFPAQLLPDFVT